MGIVSVFYAAFGYLALLAAILWGMLFVGDGAVFPNMDAAANRGAARGSSRRSRSALVAGAPTPIVKPRNAARFRAASRYRADSSTARKHGQRPRCCIHLCRLAAPAANPLGRNGAHAVGAFRALLSSPGRDSDRRISCESSGVFKIGAAADTAASAGRMTSGTREPQRNDLSRARSVSRSIAESSSRYGPRR